MGNTQISTFPLGSGQGVRESDLAPNSGLRNGFLMGHTSNLSSNAIITTTKSLGGAPDSLNNWHVLEPVTRQRMPISMTPCIRSVLVSGGDVTVQYRVWGFNLFGQAQFEETPPIIRNGGAGTIVTVILSKPFAIITNVEYKVSALGYGTTTEVGARAFWDRETAIGAGTFVIGRSHIGIELPVMCEQPQSAQEFLSPQVLSFKVCNHGNPAGFDADNVAELQPTTDEVGSLGGFIIGDKYLNTEADKGWAGYANKVRIVRTPGVKTVRADSAVTTFRFGIDDQTNLDVIYYYLEARSGLGTGRTFAVPL